MSALSTNQACSPLIDKEWKELVAKELSIGGYQCGDISNNVDFWWSLRASCVYSDKKLRYLYVLSDGYSALMACMAQQVDTSRSSGEQHSRNKAKSRADGWSEAQQTQGASSRSDSISRAFYDDFTNREMDSRAERNSKSTSREDEYRNYDDTGSGGSSSITDAETIGCGSSAKTTSSKGITSTAGNGTRGGCDYTYTSWGANGAGVSTADGALGLSGSVSVSGNGTLNNWDRFMSHSEKYEQDDKQSSASESNSLSTQKRDSITNRDSSAYFYALVDGNNRGSSQSRSDDQSHATRREDDHAEGFGQAQSSGNSEGNNQMQGSSKAHDDGEAARHTERSGWSMADTMRLSQRFQHIKQLYDQNSLLIKQRERELKAGMMPVVLCEPEKKCCSRCGRTPNICQCNSRYGGSRW